MYLHDISLLLHASIHINCLKEGTKMSSKKLKKNEKNFGYIHIYFLIILNAPIIIWGRVSACDTRNAQCYLLQTLKININEAHDTFTERKIKQYIARNSSVSISIYMLTFCVRLFYAYLTNELCQHFFTTKSPCSHTKQQ